MYPLNFTAKRQHQVFSVNPAIDEELIFVVMGENGDASSLYIRAFQDGVNVPFNRNEIAERLVWHGLIAESESEIRLLISDYNNIAESFTLELSCG
jgi:hypothetical protein